MSVVLTLDRAQMQAVEEAIVREVLLAATRSIRAETKGLERDLEDATRSHVPGRLWRAWGSKAFPKAGTAAWEPSGSVFVNGGARSRGAIKYWTQSGVNRSASGFYLAVPTAQAGPRGRARDLTPGEWERRNGIKLHFVYRGGGKPALLMARQVLFGANGSGVRPVTVRRVKNKKYANVDGSAVKTRDVPIFVLIPLQRFANKFSLAPIIARREKMLVDNFEKRLSKIAGQVHRGLRG